MTPVPSGFNTKTKFYFAQYALARSKIVEQLMHSIQFITICTKLAPKQTFRRQINYAELHMMQKFRFDQDQPLVMSLASTRAVHANQEYMTKAFDLLSRPL